MIWVSSNERASVIDGVKKHAEDVESKPLEVGDFHVCANRDSVPTYVVERKTLEDLRQSFCRGAHLQDQMARLEKDAGEKGYRFFLLVETGKPLSWSGKPTFSASRKGMSDKPLASCLAKLQIAGVPVVLVTSVEETGMFLKWLSKRCAEHTPDPVRPSDVLGGSVPIFASTPRAKGATEKDVVQAMLTCIPGVSKAKAASVLKRRKSVRDLCARALSADEFAKGENIGKTTVDKINSFFVNSSLVGNLE